jgi:YHS domain-containing protein
MRHLASVAVAALLVTIALPALAKDAKSDPSVYPLATCIVSGETLDPSDTVTKEYDGRQMRFCCNRCVKKFEKDKGGYLAKLDAAIIADQLPGYPMTTCPVSGEELGGMGDAVNHVVGNRLVRLCCEKCVKRIDADPATYIAQLDAAVIAAQGDAYTATTCPISGETLGSMGKAFDYVYAGHLVRFCCGGCIDDFNADPQGAMAKVSAASAKPDAAHEGGHMPHGGDHSGHGH